MAQRLAVQQPRVRRRGHDGVRFQRVSDRDRSVYKDVGIVFEQGRDAVETALTSAGIQTRRYFHPAHLMRAYQAFALTSLPVTERLAHQVLCVPMFNTMDLTDVDHVCEVIHAVLGRPM